MAARRAGRTKTSKETSALTGLPGSMTTGTPSNIPTPWGIPGCTATLTNSTPRPESASLTTSYEPSLTPPDVSTKSTSTALDRTRPKCLQEARHVVGDEARPHAMRARTAHCRLEHDAVGVMDLTRPELPSRFDQLRAGREDQHTKRRDPMS